MTDILRDVELEHEKGRVEIRFAHEDVRPHKVFLISTSHKHPEVLFIGSQNGAPTIGITDGKTVNGPDDVTTVFFFGYEDWIVRTTQIDKDNVIVFLTKDVDEVPDNDWEVMYKPNSPLPPSTENLFSISFGPWLTKVYKLFKRK